MLLKTGAIWNCCRCCFVYRGVNVKVSRKYPLEQTGLAESWQRLEHDALQLAAFGKARLDGKVAYLATVQENGAPRVHPVTPIIGKGRCFIFAEPGSSKVRDLSNNGRYALHCGMTDSSGSSGEFRMMGEALEITDPGVREVAESICSFRPSGRYRLYELLVEEVVSTAYRGGRPDRSRWSANVTDAAATS